MKRSEMSVRDLKEERIRTIDTMFRELAEQRDAIAARINDLRQERYRLTQSMEEEE